MKTAVALFIFKRIDTTARIIETLRNIKPTRVYLIADGPRSNIENEQTQCLKTRQTIEKEIDWECQILTKYSETNLGGPTNIINGISWVFEHEDQAIFLEDDDLPSESFFYFCENMLDKYKDNFNIKIVTSGDKDMGVAKKHKDSYFFDKHILSILGFALWKSRWNQFDFQMNDWPTLKNNGKIKELFTSKKRYEILSNEWDNLFNKSNQSWDYFLLYNFYRSSGSCIIPTTNLVENIGIRPDATRTTTNNPLIKSAKRSELNFPLTHPKKIVSNEKSDLSLHRRKHGIKAKLGKALIKLKLV